MHALWCGVLGVEAPWEAIPQTSATGGGLAPPMVPITRIYSLVGQGRGWDLNPRRVDYDSTVITTKLPRLSIRRKSCLLISIL